MDSINYRKKYTIYVNALQTVAINYYYYFVLSFFVYLSSSALICPFLVLYPEVHICEVCGYFAVLRFN